MRAQREQEVVQEEPQAAKAGFSVLAAGCITTIYAYVLITQLREFALFCIAENTKTSQSLTLNW